MVAGGLLLITILMRSVNAWAWLGIGLVTLFVTERFRTRGLIVALILIVPLYTFAQGISVWPTELSVDFMTGLIGPERAQSLEFRYFNEEYLTAKARQQWLFGWAGWDRQHVFWEWSSGRTVADSLWIIVLGKFGLVGLIALISLMLLPTIMFMYRYPPWLWNHARIAPAAAFAVIMVLYMLDGLLNAMINPVYMLVAGGLMSIYVAVPTTEKATSSSFSGLETMPATS